MKQVTISNKIMDEIHKALPYGTKSELAKFLGILPAALSRYLNQTQLGYRMPEKVFNSINQFINTKHTQHGTIPTKTVQKTEPPNQPVGTSDPATGRV